MSTSRVRIATLTAVFIAAMLLGLAPATAGAAAESNTSLADLEDEVMCPVCGTLLGLADAPQARRQKAMIQRHVEQGRSKQEIKDAMVAEFGPDVLALPEDSGFGLTAYLVPIVGFLIAVAALSAAVVRWRRRPPDRKEPEQNRLEFDDAERERKLDQDIARYEL